MSDVDELAGPADSGPLNLRPERVDPRTLTLLEVNARYMRKEVYDRLVANVRRDGALTSTPLVWNDTAGERMVVLSGNHRIMAALDVGLEQVDVIVVDQPLTRARQVALQLSHNAIEGEDDPATLKHLYEELDDVDWRAYSGLDDKQLDLLAQVDLEGLSEANLDFATVQLVFLPHELDAARASFDEARKLVQADARWLAAYGDYEATLDALATAHGAHNVGNVATALGLILAVFERHLGELRDGVWLDEESGEPIGHAHRLVPIETVLETRSMPADAAAVLHRAVDKLVRTGEVPADQRWRALELLAADYLAG
ncbi:ParB N-terminal domain-containing protein [Micromonospora aurantiaca]|uniref:ParB N-terminal domain-containing protein n=1 Tax=Micromonospora aurantiaca (nom. illeg.) TaxID=47850 RepID=UPI001E644144|nr:ParB N-terminal domain-containing protein [Micromonospora aurantiaca]UFN92490.1 ParB N-terminal domain-containing protein [Micromonospora aurantiaca]